jgi:hypothetical protein
MRRRRAAILKGAADKAHATEEKGADGVLEEIDKVLESEERGLLAAFDVCSDSVIQTRISPAVCSIHVLAAQSMDSGGKRHTQAATATVALT